METPTNGTRSPRLGLILGFILVMFLAAGLTCSSTGQVPEEEIDFTVQRLDPQVFSGAPSGRMSPLENSSPLPLPKGHRVSTDAAGHALLEGQLSVNKMCRIYVFHLSALTTKACSKSNYQGSNTATCQEENTAVYKECKGNVQMTPSGEVQIVGSWLSLTYLRDRQVTLVIVADGAAAVQPVTEFDSWTLARPIVVEAQQFLYTAPDAMLQEIAGLPPREALPVAELPPLVQELRIESWIEQVIDRAARDDVPLQVELGQVPSPTTRPPTTSPPTTPPPTSPPPTTPPPTSPPPTTRPPTSPPPTTPPPTTPPPTTPPPTLPVTPSPIPITSSPFPVTPTPGARDMHFVVELLESPSPPEEQGGVAWAIWSPHVVEYLMPKPEFCDGEPYPGDPDVIYWGTTQENVVSDLHYGQRIEVYGECFLDMGFPAVRIPPESPYFLRIYESSP